MVTPMVNVEEILYHYIKSDLCIHLYMLTYVKKWSFAYFHSSMYVLALVVTITWPSPPDFIITETVLKTQGT